MNCFKKLFYFKKFWFKNLFYTIKNIIKNSINFFLNLYAKYLNKNNLIDFSAKLMTNIPPEQAHNISLYLLSKPVVYSRIANRYIASYDLSVEINGLGKLRHPVGLAAGYDKNATSLSGLFRLDFSFIEVGTVTPIPQLGNPKPRVFRLKDSQELINRMGFPSAGMDQCQKMIASHDLDKSSVIGLNIGKNRQTKLVNALEDYISVLARLSSSASYFVINISSPNTPDLRNLANSSFLKSLMDEIVKLDAKLIKKIWIKLDPDLDKNNFIELIETICFCGFAGVILTNTHKVNYPYKGGLSGHSLRSLAMQRLMWAHKIHKGQLQVIAVGGIFTGCDVFQALECGACAVQIYTAMIYRGVWVVNKILQELEWQMKIRGIKSLGEINVVNSVNS